MSIDIRVLDILLSVINLLQMLALVFQWRLDRRNSGPGWWALTGLCVTIAFAAVSARSIPGLETPGVLTNTLLFLLAGVFVYIGTLRFFGQREKRGLVLGYIAAFTLLILYFTFVQDSVQLRRGVIYALSIFSSFLVFATLLRHRTKDVSATAGMLAASFAVQGFLYVAALLLVITEAAPANLLVATPDQILAYSTVTLSTTVWTLAFILMINQRQAAEINEAGENRERIFNTSPDAVVISTLEDGRMVDVNDGFTALLGYSRLEALGETSASIPLLKNAQDRQMMMSLLREKGFCENLEITFLRKDSSEMAGLLSARLIDLRGKPHIISVTRDITQLRQAQDRLQRSEAQFRLLAENMVDVVWTMDPEGKFTYISPSVEKLRGYTPQEVMTQEMSEVLAPESVNVMRELISDFYQKYRQGLRPGQFEPSVTELEQPCKDGSTVWTEAVTRSLFDQNGIFIGILGVTRDITSRRKAQAALRASEHLYHDMFDSNTAVKLILDPLTRKIVKANRAAAVFYGWSVEQLEGMDMGQINTLPEDAMRERMNAAASRNSNHFEFRHRLASGEVRDVEVYAGPVDVDGRNLMLTIIHDITDRKLAEAALQEAHDWLEERVQERTSQLEAVNSALELALRSRDEFLAAINHELRTPLTAILGLSQVLQFPDSNDNLTPRQVRAVTSIEKSGQRLLGLVNDIIDYSRLQSGSLQLELAPCSLTTLCNTVLAGVRDSAAAKKQELIFITAPGNITLSADEGQLRIVLNHLLVNAIKFTPSMGTVTLEVSGDLDAKRVKITVSDTGIGIREQDLPRLFKPFVQLDARLAREYEGAGLGLALARKLVELHGGTLQVESVFGEGSRFIVSLPWLISVEN